MLFTLIFLSSNGCIFYQLEAAAVNLVAGEKPADVYSEIAVRYNNSLRTGLVHLIMPIWIAIDHLFPVQLILHKPNKKDKQKIFQAIAFLYWIFLASMENLFLGKTIYEPFFFTSS